MEGTERDAAVHRNLIDAGCESELVERFFALQAQGRNREQMSLLAAHRRLLLDDIHRGQRCLDCLDYLLHQMRKEINGAKGANKP